MQKIATLFLAAGALLFTGYAVADDMKKMPTMADGKKMDAMGKPDMMKKDSMKKDEMKKDAMKSDAMKKNDAMKKEDMGKGGMKAY